MNLQQSIDHLRRLGFVVSKHPHCDLYDIHRIGRKQFCPSALFEEYWKPAWRLRPSMLYDWSQEPYCYRVRGVLRFARDHSAASRQRTTIKRNVKQTSKGKDRTFKRKLTTSHDIQKIDDMSSHNHPLRTDDIWNWT